MTGKEQLRKQMNNVKQETDSSAVMNDVMDSEFEQFPGQNEKRTENNTLSPLEEEVVTNNTDGKTWNTQKDS
ncbi:hypothetical protein [Terrihalobacillus insolitus]|uniref:hypothetical protein n=1 Tax=Terrihalobacillus insolitus TaxID=2950438 RepID=UPI00233F9DBC|nr:hypothetical protein [Terrihalobacillus insolitus]MDC3413483.1 hypothetical protein [Terrihalobacillus insolitus]